MQCVHDVRNITDHCLKIKTELHAFVPTCYDLQSLYLSHSKLEWGCQSSCEYWREPSLSTHCDHPQTTLKVTAVTLKQYFTDFLFGLYCINACDFVFEDWRLMGGERGRRERGRERGE